MEIYQQKEFMVGEKLAIKIVAGKDSELEDFVITPEDHELVLNSIKDITSE